MRMAARFLDGSHLDLAARRAPVTVDVARCPFSGTRATSTRSRSLRSAGRLRRQGLPEPALGVRVVVVALDRDVALSLVQPDRLGEGGVGVEDDAGPAAREHLGLEPSEQ